MGAMLGGTCGARNREQRTCNTPHQRVGDLRGEGHNQGSSGDTSPELDAWINHSTIPDLSATVANARRKSTREGWFKLLGAGLIDAASDGNLAGVKQLLACGAPIRSRDGEGLTPLHRASVAGHASVAGLLLLDGEGSPPLEVSSPQGVGQQQRPTRLVWKASGGGPLLVPSVSLRKKVMLNARDTSGSCPIHLAAARGHAQVVQVLVQHGTDISSCNGLKQTPIHAAASARSPANSLRILLDAGGDVNSRDNAGRTPLHYAASVGTPAAISILVEGGADLEARGSISDRTALHDACTSLRAENVKRLLDLGADEHVVDSDGLTPLAVVGEGVAEEEGLLDSTIAEMEDRIRIFLEGAQKDRLWRRRRLLPLLRRRRPPPAYDSRLVPATVGTDSDMWILDRAAVLEPGIVRNIVSYL